MKREKDSGEEDEKPGGRRGGSWEAGFWLVWLFCSTGWKSLKSSQKVFLFLFLKARLR